MRVKQSRGTRFSPGWKESEKDMSVAVTDGDWAPNGDEEGDEAMGVWCLDTQSIDRDSCCGWRCTGRRGSSERR